MEIDQSKSMDDTMFSIAPSDEDRCISSQSPASSPRLPSPGPSSSQLLPESFPLEELPLDMIEVIVSQCSMIKGGSGLRRSCMAMKSRFDTMIKRISYCPDKGSSNGLNIYTLASMVKKARCLEALEIDTSVSPSPNFNLVTLFALPTPNGALGPALRALKITKNYQLLRQAREIGNCCPSLREIELDGTCSSHVGIGYKDMDTIVRGCPYLEKIKIKGGRYMRLYDPHHHTIFGTVPLCHLIDLDISQSNIEDISSLSLSTKLKHLSLGQCRDLKSIAALTSCINLESLDLNHTHLLDIAPLALLTRLKRLNFEWGRVDSNDLSPLQPLLELQELNLTGLYPHPTTPLACITGAKHLKILKLCHSSSMSTATLFLPSSCLQGCLSLLQELDLSFSGSYEISSVLSLDLESLRKFKMTSNICVEQLTGSCRWPNLKAVDLSHCKVLSDISAFTNCHLIEELDLSGTNVTSLVPFAGCQLRVLNFSCCYSLDSLQLGILDGTNLTTVRMRRCYYVDSISFLATAHGLQELNISDTAVKDLSPLQGSSLRVMYANNCRIEDLTPLSSLSSLETLDLSECHYLTSIKPLGALAASLSKLYLRNCFRVEDISPLLQCFALTFVDIGYLKLSDHGSHPVLKTLQQRKVCTITYPHIQRVRLSTSETLMIFVLGCTRVFKSLFQRHV